MARRNAPRKSIRANELRLSSCGTVEGGRSPFMALASESSSMGTVSSTMSFTWTFACPRGRNNQLSKVARRKTGACPVNDHRQPIVSARNPPTGPPRLRPVVAARLRPACHAATSRSGTRSSLKLEEDASETRIYRWEPQT